MRNTGTNKQQYQIDRSALKLSPQMSNSRHQISNLKVENVNSQQSINCATLNQWKSSHQIPITAPVQVSQFLTQQLQNQLKSTQNHLICTCPPEVHKALLEQQLLQHQNQHSHFPAQHFQPCPHQRQNIKSVITNTGIDPQSLYALVNNQQQLQKQVPQQQQQQQQTQPFIQPGNKTMTPTAFSVDSNSVLNLQQSSNQLSMSYPNITNQTQSWYMRQSSVPETLTDARAQITKMESQLMYLTSWIQSNIHQANVTNNSNHSTTNGTYGGTEPNYVPAVLDSVGLSQHGACLPCYIVTNDRLVSDVRDGHSNVEATPSNSSLDSAYSAKSTTSSDNNSNVQKQQYIIPDNALNYVPLRTEYKIPAHVINKLTESQLQLQAMRQDVTALRKWNHSLRFSFKDEINDTFLKIKKLISSTPGINNIPIRREREKIDNEINVYESDVEFQIDKLEDLEVAIEDLRMNVLNRRCRVNIEEVEVLALHLSKISKGLAMDKADFPSLEMNVRKIIQTEMEMMKKDERFLESEPRKVENALRLCKKLISTLFTLKRLGSVQENTGSDGIPEIRSNWDPKQKDRQSVLDDIKSLSPDHDYRMEQIALSEKLRECRKRMLTSHESMKFEKSLELAAKTLKEVILPPSSNTVKEGYRDQSTYAKIVPLASTRECDSLSSLTDSDLDGTTRSESGSARKEPSAQRPSHMPLLGDQSHTSSSDSSDTGTASFRSRCLGSVPWSGSSRLVSRHGTILKTSQHSSSRSNRSSKVAFNRTVTVEGGCEVLQLNCPEDEYDDNDLSSMTFSAQPPPPPPPRLSSQDETVCMPDSGAGDGGTSTIWHQQ